jgi:hypothetical protein
MERVIIVRTDECIGVNTNLLAPGVSATGRQVVLHYTDSDGQWSGTSLLGCGWRWSFVCELNWASLGKKTFGLQFCKRNNRHYFFVHKIPAFYCSDRRFRRFIFLTEEDSGVLLFLQKFLTFYFPYRRRFRRFIVRTEDSNVLFSVQKKIPAFYCSDRRFRRFIFLTEEDSGVLLFGQKIPTFYFPYRRRFQRFIVRTEDAFSVPFFGEPDNSVWCGGHHDPARRLCSSWQPCGYDLLSLGC